MFDDLDDPGAFAPRPGAHDGVLARAGVLRRRRRAAWAGSATSFVLVLAGVAYTLGSPSPEATGVVATTDSPTPDATPSETPSPTPTPTPNVTTTGPTTPTPSSAEPSVTPSSRVITDSVESLYPGRDGKPGWSGGFTGCEVPKSLPSPTGPPLPFLTMTANIPETVHRRDSGTITIRNDSAYYVRIDYSTDGSDTRGRNVDTGEMTGYSWGDVEITSETTLDPGESFDVPLAIVTSSCGDGPNDPPPSVSPGRYEMVAPFVWYRVRAWTSPQTEPSSQPSQDPSADPSPSPSEGPVHDKGYGTWYSPRIPVRIA